MPGNQKVFVFVFFRVKSFFIFLFVEICIMYLFIQSLIYLYFVVFFLFVRNHLLLPNAVSNSYKCFIIWFLKFYLFNLIYLFIIYFLISHYMTLVSFPSILFLLHFLFWYNSCFFVITVFLSSFCIYFFNFWSMFTFSVESDSRSRRQSLFFFYSIQHAQCTK